MPLIIHPPTRRDRALIQLFDELGLSDQDVRNCQKMLRADPTEDLQFGIYLLRLYAQSSSVERVRLVDEDYDKIRTYLWCAKELEAYQVSIKMYNAGAGGKTIQRLPDLYSQIKPQLRLLGEVDPPPPPTLKAC